MEEQKYYLVGIDGTSTPDPQYWFDRWETIKAASHEEARQKWIEKKKGWLRDDERQYVAIWTVSNEYFSPWFWIRENYIDDKLPKPLYFFRD